MSTTISSSYSRASWTPPPTRSGSREGGFERVDRDGSGSVDTRELQSLLDVQAERSGSSAADAGELIGQLDGDGDGALSSSEMEAGRDLLMPAAASTLEFAGQRAGGTAEERFAALDADGSGALDASEFAAGEAEAQGGAPVQGAAAAQGPRGPGPAGGMPPGPPPVDEEDDEDEIDALQSLSALVDADGDGTLSETERAGFLEALESVTGSMQADATGASSGSGEADGESPGGGSRDEDLRGLVRSLIAYYTQAQADEAASSVGSTLDAQA